VLEDIPRVWAEDAIQVKRVLEFVVFLPNPRAPLDVDYVSSNPFGAFNQLSERAAALGIGLKAISDLPGSSQATLQDGTSLVDLQIRQRSFCEQDLTAFENRMLFQQGSSLELALIQEAMVSQIQAREEELEIAQRRVEMLKQTFHDYINGRQKRPIVPGERGTKNGDTQESAPEEAGMVETTSEVPILNRLSDAASMGQDTSYRKEFIDRITRAREDAATKEMRLEEARRNIFLVKKDDVRSSPRGSPSGSQIDPLTKSLALSKSSLAFDIGEFAAIWGELSQLIGLASDIVGVISRHNIPHDTPLYTISQSFEQRTYSKTGGVNLALFLASWCSLGFGVLVFFRWFVYWLRRGRKIQGSKK
jgi:hypothetical protein